VLAAAESDPAVVQQFLRLMNLVDPPSHLLRPSTMLRVLKKSQKRAAVEEATQSAETQDADSTGSLCNTSLKERLPGT
jgi:hypothetical protein